MLRGSSTSLVSTASGVHLPVAQDPRREGAYYPMDPNPFETVSATVKTEHTVFEDFFIPLPSLHAAV